MEQTHNSKNTVKGQEASVTADKARPRMANLELLRCIAMMMVVVLHYLSKGGLLGDLTAGNLTPTGMVAWILEVFCIVAVNVYMLISGYFLSTSSFKLSRLLRLWFQVWVYSVGIGLVAAFTGILPAGEFNLHYLLSLLFPVSMGHYWFMTAYVYLYLLLPLIGMAVSKMTKGQMKAALFGLLSVFCVLKSVLPFRLEMDGQGYDCIWYLCVFLTAAYIRRFGWSFFRIRIRCIVLYVLACLAVLGEVLCFQQIFLRTGNLELIMKISTEYNHIFPFLAALGLFMTFLSVRVSDRASKIINRVAPYTLGVYLFHENLGVRYAWQNWLGADKVTGRFSLILSTLTAMVIVFVLGVAIDFLRDKAMGGLDWIFNHFRPYRTCKAKIASVDSRFAKEIE